MLAMTLEHGGWHVEVRMIPTPSYSCFCQCRGLVLMCGRAHQTFLYILLQQGGTGTLPPPGFVPPPWSALAAAWDASAHAPSTPTVTIGLNTIMLGHDDCKGNDLKPEVTHCVDRHEFGWDNESLVSRVEVGQVRIEWRPVNNKEYLAFWSAGGQTQAEFPPSWVSSEEGIQVCFFGASVWVRKSAHLGAGPHFVWACADKRCRALAGADIV